MRIKLIANPVSGGNARPRIDRACAILKDLGAEVELCLTGARGDAAKAAALARSQGFDRIVAAGGDGTLNEVVNGVASPTPPVAFLPLGTVNVFALEAGIPGHLDAACALAVQGTPRQVTLGRVNDELFLLMVSAGWDAEAVAKVSPGLKRRIGRLAYAISALKVLLLQKSAPLELKLDDGRCYRGFGAIVSNCKYYGGRYVVTPWASMLRGDLDACLLRKSGRLAMLRFAVALIMKRPLRAPLVEFVTFSSAELCGGKVAVQVDGDSRGELPVRLEAVPCAISLVLPHAPESEETDS